MVVVNNGQPYIGQQIEVQVQTLLQTGAGVDRFAEVKTQTILKTIDFLDLPPCNLSPASTHVQPARGPDGPCPARNRRL